ncbi:hypothetical protein B0H11DRAFT_2254159 [Mycena galericulata]|nr:hypothetical protein B0H11DRAFT_2254159 [Mycena galericulata]
MPSSHQATMSELTAAVQTDPDISPSKTHRKDGKALASGSGGTGTEELGTSIGARVYRIRGRCADGRKDLVASGICARAECRAAGELHVTAVVGPIYTDFDFDHSSLTHTFSHPIRTLPNPPSSLLTQPSAMPHPSLPNFLSRLELGRLKFTLIDRCARSPAASADTVPAFALALKCVTSATRSVGRNRGSLTRFHSQHSQIPAARKEACVGRFLLFSPPTFSWSMYDLILPRYLLLPAVPLPPFPSIPSFTFSCLAAPVLTPLPHPTPATKTRYVVETPLIPKQHATSDTYGDLALSAGCVT